MEKQTLTINWPLCHVPTINGETPLINLNLIGALLPAKVQPDGPHGNLVVGQRECVLMIIGAAQLPIEVDVGEALRRVMLEHAEAAIEVAVASEASKNGDSSQKSDASLT